VSGGGSDDPQIAYNRNVGAASGVLFVFAAAGRSGGQASSSFLRQPCSHRLQDALTLHMVCGSIPLSEYPEKATAAFRSLQASPCILHILALQEVLKPD